jgi:hypothetical protein
MGGQRVGVGGRRVGVGARGVGAEGQGVASRRADQAPGPLRDERPDPGVVARIVQVEAQARWRNEQRLERRPTPEEEARADSIIAVVRAHGVWTRRAEGDTYFSVDESVMLGRLGPYLTRGMVDFLGMQVHEQRGPVADDGALLIPLNELTRRIRWAEGFREAYPGSPVVDVVESRYRWYLAIYLAGLPNTQPFDWRTSELDPEWRESLEHYAENHADLDSGALASRYLDLLEESGFKRNEEIVAFLSELWAGRGHLGGGVPGPRIRGSWLPAGSAAETPGPPKRVEVSRPWDEVALAGCLAVRG